MRRYQTARIIVRTHGQTGDPVQDGSITLTGIIAAGRKRTSFEVPGSAGILPAAPQDRT